jgi:acetyl esterase/lipase
MIHAGGHVMLSRKDVRPRQTQLLLDHGVLPIAVDYRLCPEIAILEGPLTDVSDAYLWARNTLPSLKLKHTSVNIEPGRVVVIGWSTGGTLAMSLAWTSAPRGLPPPEGILVFYCPTNYEDEFWQKRNVPDHSELYSHEAFNILECVRKAPITAYNVSPKLMANGGWMTPKDARSRLVLHMNWHGQTLPVLFRGLPSADAVSPAEAAKFTQMEQPPTEDIVQASPYAQITRGNYKSPTHIIFGMNDDLIPWQQAQQTADALRDAGVESGITLLPNQPHLFDMYRDPDGKRWEAVLEGYRFLLGKVGKSL